MYTGPYHVEIYEGSPSADDPSPPSSSPSSLTFSGNRYESQKQRDWNTFSRYLRNLQPPVTISTCTGDHVVEFLRELDQFGKTKVHGEDCRFFGQPDSPAPCSCPLRQAWGSLDALIGRLRAAFEKHEGKLAPNPFGAPEVKLYLREVRELQAKARGVTYNKKKKMRHPLMAGSSYQPPEEA